MDARELNSCGLSLFSYAISIVVVLGIPKKWGLDVSYFIVSNSEWF